MRLMCTTSHVGGVGAKVAVRRNGHDFIIGWGELSGDTKRANKLFEQLLALARCSPGKPQEDFVSYVIGSGVVAFVVAQFLLLLVFKVADAFELTGVFCSGDNLLFVRLHEVVRSVG